MKTQFLRYPLFLVILSYFSCGGGGGVSRNAGKVAEEALEKFVPEFYAESKIIIEESFSKQLVGKVRVEATRHKREFKDFGNFIEPIPTINETPNVTEKTAFPAFGFPPLRKMYMPALLMTPELNETTNKVLMDVKNGNCDYYVKSKDSIIIKKKINDQSVLTISLSTSDWEEAVRAKPNKSNWNFYIEDAPRVYKANNYILPPPPPPSPRIKQLDSLCNFNRYAAYFNHINRDKIHVEHEIEKENLLLNIKIDNIIDNLENVYLVIWFFTSDNETQNSELSQRKLFNKFGRQIRIEKKIFLEKGDNEPIKLQISIDELHLKFKRRTTIKQGTAMIQVVVGVINQKGDLLYKTDVRSNRISFYKEGDKISETQ